MLDFFTNYGRYMARVHCLRTAEGSPDWPWIIALIVLNAAVIAGYLKIFFYWYLQYRREPVEDRNAKLMQLAGLFLFCGLIGYAGSILMFFWPAYRLIAILMFILVSLLWLFAWRLESLDELFVGNRRRREVKQLALDNKALDDFAYAVSHDLRSPLRAVRNLAAWAVEDGGEQFPEASKEHLDVLQKRIERMDSLLEDMLSYARIGREEEHFESFYSKTAIAEVIESLDVPDSFQIELEGMFVQLHSSKVAFQLVFQNLIENALKHHDLGKGRVVLRCEAEADSARFSIVDDGPGIAAQHHQRIFKAFETLKPRGSSKSTGMGLALVKKQVEERGGTINVCSNGMRGTTFSFRWPMRERAV